MPSFVICDGMVSRIRYWRRQRYLKRKYANKPPRIYYDRRYRTYISPTNLDEDGPVLWVCGEMARSGLFYEYCLGDHETHAHNFDHVLMDAYNRAEVFSIPEEYREQYSGQELEFLKKLVQRGLRDRERSEKDSTEEKDG